MEYLDLKKQILEKIKAYQSIIIVRHIKPDGDCMGSSLGLRAILQASFPEKKIYSVGRMKADYLGFIGAEDEQPSEDVYRSSLLLALDTATKDRIDDNLFHLCPESIKIDHHIPVEDYGSVNYVREDFPATSAIIADFYQTFANELVLNYQAARALFVGIVTDTGRFKYQGVDSQLMRLTAILLEHDLNIEEIYSNLYIKEKEALKLQGYVLNNFKTTQNGVAYLKMTRRIQKRYQVSVDEASALINSLDSIKDHLIWIFFIEHPDGKIRVRLRSRFVSINEVAEKYRGGGHKQAAGAAVNNRREIKALLAEADQLLEKFKKDNPEVF
ncbi:MAG: bifunctional oligoribonuclease/PAP phosphatase NrnA [Acholeplasmataceae bacterium]|nr:bifunctional oligoribonuclease/PAP phosphatase NrnA [Acholeplasmataceae bacterium]